MRRFVDDAVQVGIGALHLRPRSHDEGTLLLDRPVPAAVNFRWTASDLSGSITLRCGRTSATFRLAATPAPHLFRSGRDPGLEWRFVDDDETTTRKLYFLQERWGTRASLGLTYRVRHLGRRKRLRLMRTKIVRELADIISRRPYHARQERLEGRLLMINEELENA
jgi:hypothetical protein